MYDLKFGSILSSDTEQLKLYDHQGAKYTIRSEFTQTQNVVIQVKPIFGTDHVVIVNRKKYTFVKNRTLIFLIC